MSNIGKIGYIQTRWVLFFCGVPFIFWFSYQLYCEHKINSFIDSNYGHGAPVEISGSVDVDLWRNVFSISDMKISSGKTIIEGGVNISGVDFFNINDPYGKKVSAEIYAKNAVIDGAQVDSDILLKISIDQDVSNVSVLGLSFVLEEGGSKLYYDSVIDIKNSPDFIKGISSSFMGNHKYFYLNEDFVIAAAMAVPASFSFSLVNDNYIVNKWKKSLGNVHQNMDEDSSLKVIESQLDIFKNLIKDKQLAERVKSLILDNGQLGIVAHQNKPHTFFDLYLILTGQGDKDEAHNVYTLTVME